MSREVEEKVVSMQLDNKNFESNARTSMNTIDKLEEKLNFKGITKGVDAMNDAVKKTDMSVIGRGVEAVHAKFSALQVMGITTLSNITNQAVNAGKRIVSALTIDPIKTGFQEYETQINSVQTILANTESKGSTLQDVNNALAELNTYADKTIYNFTEMTRNIGTFTAAGVDLDTSVSAIKGIANLAAVSGSTSQQASTAMYQLSQALSSGTVKLMDWNSVTNAGMGGQVFQDALKETARVHGIAIDKMIESEGSFRETLQEGWLTSEILTETLNKFTGDLSEKQLKAMGYNDEQIAGIVKMGKTANDAATKVKTFTQLFDTMQEASQSGWTKTWEILVGDFGEAKDLLTEISDMAGGFIGAMSDSRNELLGGALSTGWKQLLNEGLTDAAGFEETVTNVAKKHGTDLSKMINDETTFQDTLKEGWLNAEILSESIENYGKKLKGMSEAELEAAGYTMKDVKAFEELEKKLKNGTISLEEFSKLISRPSGRELLIESLKNSLAALIELIKPVTEGFREIFPATTAEQLYGFIEKIRDFTESLTISEKTAGYLKRTFKGVFALFDIGYQIVKALFGGFTDLVGAVLPAGNGILSFTAGIGDFIVSIDEAIKSSNIFKKAVDAIVKFLKPIAEGVMDLGRSISDSVTDIAGTAEVRLEPLTILGNFIKKIFVGIGNIVGKVLPFVSTAASGIANVLGSLMDKIASSIQGADFSKLFDFANGGIFAAIGVYIAKFIKSGGDLLDNAGGFIEGFKDILGGVSDSLNAFSESIKANTLKTIATAVGILAASLLVISLIDSEKLTASLAAVSSLFMELMLSMEIFGRISDGKKFDNIGKISRAMISLSAALLVLSIAMKIMSTMSWREMSVGLISITVGLGALVGAVNLLPDSKVTKASKAIKKMASAMLVLSVSIKILSTMSWKEMGVGLISMVVGLGALVGAVHLLPKDTTARAAGMMALATSMVILSAALKIMATMTWGDIARSLVALAGSLAILAVSMALMKQGIPGAAAMMIIAPALVILSSALKIMSGMSWGEVVKGLTALAGSLLIISGAMYLMTTALPGAAALLVVSASLMILAPVMKILGSMSWGEIVKGLVALAGAFAIIGIAGAVLGPLVPVILGLAGSIALIGVGVLAAGVGVTVFAAGLTALAAALAVSGGAIVTFVASIIGLIPFLIEQIGVGIIALCETIAGSADAICKAVAVIIVAIVDALVASVPSLVEGALVLITSLLTSLAKHTPVIVGALFDFLIGLINGVAQRLPDLIKAGVNLLMSLFQGVLDALKDVDPNVLVNGIMAVGMLSALVFALAAVAALTPAAMLGVIGLGLVVAELAIVLAAIGALAQIPGLEWLISEGGNFMQTIGKAIGQFIGGIVGGFAQGVSSSLPQIGSDLSLFMVNATPFIMGAKMIDSSVIEGVEALVGAVLALTAANVLESIASFITGENSITKFAEEIPLLGAGLKGFSDSVQGIVPENIAAAATAAKALAEMASVIPNEGGMAAWFAGENSISGFADELPVLGEGLKGFSDSVQGIVPENITAAANAAKALAEMASTTPKNTDKLKSFGENLVSLGDKLKSYFEKTSVITAEIITASSNALDSVKTSTTGFDPTQISQVSKAIDEMVNSLKKMSGVKSSSANGFSDALKKLGQTNVDAILKSFEGAGPKMISAGEKLINKFIDGVKNKHSNMAVAGEKVIGKFIAGINKQTTNAKKACINIMTVCSKAIADRVGSFKSSGANVVKGFADGIKSNTYIAEARSRAMARAAANAAKNELDEHSPSRVFYGIGDFAGLAFVNALGDYISKAGLAGKEIASASVHSLKSAVSRISDIINGDIDAQPTIRPVLDLSDVRSGASTIGGMFSGASLAVSARSAGAISASMSALQNGRQAGELLSAIKGLRKDFANRPTNSYSINGVSYSEGSDAAEAIRAFVRAVKVDGRS